jgi:hypothetical protein
MAHLALAASVLFLPCKDCWRMAEVATYHSHPRFLRIEMYAG